MDYRILGKNVLVQKGKKWKVLKKHKTKREAIAHLRALEKHGETKNV